MTQSTTEPLSTIRTQLLPLSEQDAGFILQLATRPDFKRFIADHNLQDEADALAYLQRGFIRCQREQGFGYFRIRHHEQDIGICGFLKKPELENPDFGFALLPEFYGQGLAEEASRCALADGISRFKFQAVDAVTLVSNYPSRKLLNRLGFIIERAEIKKAEPENPDKNLLYFRLLIKNLSAADAFALREEPDTLNHHTWDKATLNNIPDVRDGLTRKERAILYCLHQSQKEFGGRNVPTITLYGRVLELVDISELEFQTILQRFTGFTRDTHLPDH